MPILPWGKRHDAVKRAEELLRECCQRLDLDEKVLGKSGREWIARRRWGEDPHEMRRMVYAAALASSKAEIEASHFPPRRRRDHEAHAGAIFESLSLEEIVRHKIAHFFERLGSVDVEGVHGAVIAQVERPLIEEGLRWAGGNQQRVARALGINRNTLRKKMAAYRIKPCAAGAGRG